MQRTSRHRESDRPFFFFFPARLRRCQTFAITAVNDCGAHDVCGRGVWISVWKVFQLCSCDFLIKRRRRKNTSFVIESKIGCGERERESRKRKCWFHFYRVILFGIQFKFCQAINEMKLTFVLKTRDVQIANQKWMMQVFFFSLSHLYSFGFSELWKDKLKSDFSCNFFPDVELWRSLFFLALHFNTSQTINHSDAQPVYHNTHTDIGARKAFPKPDGSSCHANVKPQRTADVIWLSISG